MLYILEMIVCFTGI